MNIHIEWHGKYPNLVRLFGSNKENNEYAKELIKLVSDVAEQAQRIGICEAYDYVAAYALPTSSLSPEEIHLWRRKILQALEDWSI